MLMLWAFVIYLQNRRSVKEKEFRRRIRIVRNLLMNSSDELRDKRVRAIIYEIEELIKNGVLNMESNSFNQAQKEEEQAKFEWLADKDETQELKLSNFENFPVILGSTSILGVDDFNLFDTFINAFENPDWEQLARAVLACGDYSRAENSWRFLIAGANRPVESWRRTLSPTMDADMRQSIRRPIVALLKLLENGSSLEKIIEGYLADGDTPVTWRYYMVKYPVIINYSGYGKYYWPDVNLRQYDFYTMHTEYSTSGRHWNAFHLVISKLFPQLTLEEYGNWARDSWNNVPHCK